MQETRRRYRQVLVWLLIACLFALVSNPIALAQTAGSSSFGAAGSNFADCYWKVDFDFGRGVELTLDAKPTAPGPDRPIGTFATVVYRYQSGPDLCKSNFTVASFIKKTTKGWQRVVRLKAGETYNVIPYLVPDYLDPIKPLSTCRWNLTIGIDGAVTESVVDDVKRGVPVSFQKEGDHTVTVKFLPAVAACNRSTGGEGYEILFFVGDLPQAVTTTAPPATTSTFPPSNPVPTSVPGESGLYGWHGSVFVRSSSRVRSPDGKYDRIQNFQAKLNALGNRETSLGGIIPVETERVSGKSTLRNDTYVDLDCGIYNSSSSVKKPQYSSEIHNTRVPPRPLNQRTAGFFVRPTPDLRSWEFGSLSADRDYVPSGACARIVSQLETGRRSASIGAEYWGNPNRTLIDTKPDVLWLGFAALWGDICAVVLGGITKG